MTSKERVARAINRKEADRLPFDMFGTNESYIKRLKNHLGISTLEQLYEKMGFDIWYLDPMPYVGEKRFFQNEEADYWGITPSVYNDGDSSKKSPLREISSLDEVDRYKWPDPKDFDSQHILPQIEDHKNYAIMGGVWAPIFHNVTWLCGYETTMINMISSPDLTQAIVDKVTDFWVGYTNKVLSTGKCSIDIVQNCNDFGGQNSMLLSPDLFRRYFKPALKRLYDVIKSYGAKVMQHSCGAITPIIADLIEIGADILNPIQVTAKGMDPEDLKKDFGTQITFHGGIDTQFILPSGSGEEVRAEVRRIAKILGQDGGYILSGSQGFEADIPVENVVSMYDEGKKIGSSYF